MRLHYNTDCVHGDLPTTPLRCMYAAARYPQALQEIARLNALLLEPSQRLVVNIHEVVVRLAMNQVAYHRAKERLAQLAAHVQRHGSEEFMAKFCSRRIGIAALYRDYELMVALTNHFFDEITRSITTEALWRMAQGRSAHHAKGPQAAIPFYLTALMQLEPLHEPCLKETIARHMAACLKALNDKSEAVAVLHRAGLPVSAEPAEDKLALSDLLVLPLM